MYLQTLNALFVKKNNLQKYFIKLEFITILDAYVVQYFLYVWTCVKIEYIFVVNAELELEANHLVDV